MKRLRSIVLGLVSLICLVPFMSASAQAANTNPGKSIDYTSSDYFTIAVLPDTQYYSEDYPAIFSQQTQWIADNAQAQHIVFVSQVGDLVQDYNSDAEWTNAHDSMNIIRNAGIPYSVIPGNHDVSQAGDTTYYNNYFPYTDFTSYSWYGSGNYPPQNGAPSSNYPTGSNASNYETFSALGQNFVILNLACTPGALVNTAMESWANAVLSYYNGYKAIVVTHGYIDATGAYTDDEGVSGIEIWNDIVYPNSNVVAVISGHVHDSSQVPTEYHETVTGEHGNIIENLLYNAQSAPDGGDGWLRLYKFYPQLNKVSTVTYSPFLYQYDATSSGAFDFSVNMNPASLSTVTSVTSSPSLSYYGQSVPFIASVNPTPDGGTVQFEDNGINLGAPVALNNSGQATYSTATLPLGTHTITAIYSGDSSYYASIDSLTQIISSHAWDLNGDRVCNIGDVVVLGLHWGEKGTQGWITEDLNNDGVVNVGDLVIIGLNWGKIW